MFVVILVVMLERMVFVSILAMVVAIIEAMDHRGIGSSKVSRKHRGNRS